MDKDSLAPDASEYSKSGTDDATAGDPAFDPNTTTPEAQKKQAGPDGAGNPLEVSPANPEVSKPKEHKGSDASSAESGEGPSDRQRTSGGSGGSKTGKDAR